MTSSYERHDSFRMSDMTHSYFNGQTLRETTHLHAWHDSFVCVAWHIHMFSMTHPSALPPMLVCVCISEGRGGSSNNDVLAENRPVLQIRQDERVPNAGLHFAPYISTVLFAIAEPLFRKWLTKWKLWVAGKIRESGTSRLLIIVEHCREPMMMMCKMFINNSKS